MKRGINTPKGALILASIGVVIVIVNLVFFPISAPTITIAGIMAVQFCSSLHSYLKQKKEDI